MTRASLVLFLAAALPALAGPSMSDLIRDLGAEDGGTRAAAFAELESRYEDWSDGDMKALEAAGSDADAERAAGARAAREQLVLSRRVGRSLALAWVRLGPPEAEDATEQLAAAVNCWKGGGASDAQLKAYVEMVKGAGGDLVRSCPYELIGQCECRPLAGLIAARLDARVDEADGSRAAVIRALGQAGDPAYADRLDPYVAASFWLQHAALDAMANLRSKSMSAALAIISEDPDPDQRCLALRTLGRCATERELPAIRRRLTDPRPKVRAAAAAALAELGWKSEAPRVAILFRDQDPYVVHSAVAAYGKLGEAGNAWRLKEAARWGSRRGIADLGEVWARLKPPGWDDLLLEWMTGEDDALRESAAGGFAFCEDRSVAPRLRPLLKDPRPQVRARAVQALTWLDPRPFRDDVAALAADPSLEVQLALTDFIRECRGPGWEAAVDRLMESHDTVTVNSALRAAFVCPGPGRAEKALKLLESGDEYVSDYAAELIGRRGAPKHAADLFPCLRRPRLAGTAATALARLGAVDALPEIRKLTGREGLEALALLGDLDGFAERIGRDGAVGSVWLPSGPWNGSEMFAARALRHMDDPKVAWGSWSCRTIDGRRVHLWDAADRRELVRRLRNVARLPNKLVGNTARARLLELGEAADGEEEALLGAAAKAPLAWSSTATLDALIARHEPAAWAAASEVRTLDADLETDADVERWAASFGLPLDLGGNSTLQTWRKGSRVSLRDILSDTLFLNGFAPYVEKGRMRVIRSEEAVRLWKERLAGK